jgi:hypothetical protein
MGKMSGFFNKLHNIPKNKKEVAQGGISEII